MSELLLPILVVCAVTGMVTARIARNRGYDPVYGFAFGFFLSIFGVGIVMAIKQKKKSA